MRSPVAFVIHLDCLLRATHLLAVPGNELIPKRLKHTGTLHAFNTFYVNKYTDHHAHEIAF